MKKIKITFLALSACALVLSSCSKTGPTGPAGTAGGPGPSLTGSLEGYVDLYDQYGDLMSPANGVSITIPGRTGTDTTSATGMYKINNLSTGTYEVDLSKTGYGSTKVVSLNFVGGGTQYVQNHIQMAQPATFTLTSVTLTNVGGVITVSVTASSPDPKARRVMLFLSNATGVTSAPTTYLGSVTLNIAAGSANGAGTIQAATLNSLGIVTGNTLYVAAYPVAYNTGASSYPDIATGRTVFNNIGTSVANANIVVP